MPEYVFHQISMIDWCLMSSKQCFNYIHDKNKLTINKSCMSNGGTVMNQI